MGLAVDRVVDRLAPGDAGADLGGSTNVPAPDETFAESFGVNPERTVQLDASAGVAQVINGAGKVIASGKVTIDDDVNDDLWTAFDGLLIGSVNDTASGGKGQITAYRLDSVKPAWSSPIAFNAGDEVTYVHPCGEHAPQLLRLVLAQVGVYPDPAVLVLLNPAGHCGPVLTQRTA